MQRPPPRLFRRRGNTTYRTIFTWQRRSIQLPNGGGRVWVVDKPIKQGNKGCLPTSARTSTLYRQRIMYAENGLRFPGTLFAPAAKGKVLGVGVPKKVFRWAQRVRFESSSGQRVRLLETDVWRNTEVEGLLEELKLNGPFVIGFTAFDDYNRKDGSEVYMASKRPENKSEVKKYPTHAVVVVGLGVRTRILEDGSVEKVLYWIYENSYGRRWGNLKGFGRIAVHAVDHVYVPYCHPPPGPHHHHGGPPGGGPAAVY